MAIHKLIKWNLLVVLSTFLIACSDGGSNSSKNDRETETPIGHRIVEGNAESSTLTLYFISPTDGPLSYSTFNITAAEKSDFEPIAGTIQAEKGKEYSFDVVVYGDTKIEGNETFGIHFKDANNNAVSSVIGEIENDDFPVVISNSPLILEGDTGTAKLVFTFSLSEAVVDDYAISISSIPESAITDKTQFETKNFATPEIDYLPVDEVLTFKQGELEKQIEVTIYSDNIIEHDETVVLQVVRDLSPSQYAVGTIRTDETPDSNGFKLNIAVQDASLLEGIPEGTSLDPSQLTWKKVNYEVQVIQPQNILQDQNLIFTLLTLERSQQQYQVEYRDTEYINLSDNPDVCFTFTQTNTTVECDPTFHYVLKEDESSFIVPVYIKEDISRELDETFIIEASNDQNVHFTNVESKIKNDDSEGLQIKVAGEFVDFKTFTESGSIYELREPSGDDELNNITFRLNNGLDIKYDVGYEFAKYDKKRSAKNGEYAYATDEHTLSFVIGAASPQDVNIGLILKADTEYDGDKYLTLILKETNLAPLIIKIVDSDYPSLEGVAKFNNSELERVSGNFELKEQAEADHTSINGSDRQYVYTIKTDGGIPLLSDIKYQVEFLTDGINGTEDIDQSIEPSLCTSINRSSKIDLADITADITITDNENVDLQASGVITLKEGSNSYDLKVKVKNDPEIECQEAFKIKISPVDDQSITAVAQNFIIKDTDKALVTVQSWQTAETDAATKTQNFQFRANKKVNAVLTPLLTGQGLNCNADDLNPAIDAATTVSFTADSLEPTFPIHIKGDTTVEPDEACQLTIGTLSADLETLIEVQYLDLTGVVIENGEYATGLIENDDFLNITLDVLTDQSEPADNQVQVSIGTYSWDKKIAPNVGTISITATPKACTGSQNCVEDSDTTLGLHDANPVEPKEIVIHKGDETAILEPSLSTDLPISIIGDDIVEEIETLNFSVAQSAGGEYIQEILDAHVSINITSEDKLELQLTGSNTLGEPSSDSTPYTLSWNKQLELPAGSLPEIRVSLSDTEICDGGETLECMSENLDYNLDSAPLSLNNGSTTNLALTNFTLKPDSLVELPEALNLTLFSSSPYIENITHITSAAGFVTNTSELHSVVTHALDWQLTVNSDDKITITRPTELDTIAESCAAVDSCSTVASLRFTGEIPKNGPTITLSVNNNCAMPNPVDGTNPNQCASEVPPSTDLTNVIDSGEIDFKFNENYQSINIHTHDEDSSLTSKDIKLTVNNDPWVEVLENINLVYTAEQGRDYIDGLDEVDGEGNPVLSGLEILEPQPINLTSEDVTTVSALRVAGTGTTLDSTCNFTAGTQFSEGGTDGTDVNGCTSHYQLVIDAPIAKEVGTISAAFKLYDATALANKTPVSFTDDIAATISNTDFATSTIVLPTPVPSEPGSQQLLIPVHTQQTATTISAFANRTLFVFNHKEDVIADGTKLLGFNLVEATSATTDYFNVSGAPLTEEVIDDDTLTFALTAPTVIDQDTSTPDILDIVEGVSGQRDLTYTLSWSGVTNITLTELILDFVIAGSATQGPSDDYTISLGKGGDSPIKIENGKIKFEPSGDNSSGSETITFHINGDETVELPETISASLAISSGSATSQVAEVDAGSSDNVAINIPNDDFVTVTLFSIGNGDEDSTIKPFSYTLDKDIDASVPSISLNLDLTCNYLSDCVSYNRADYNDDYIVDTEKVVMGVIDIHTSGTSTVQSTVQMDGTRAKTDFPIQYVNDSRIEDNENLPLKVEIIEDINGGYRYVANIVDGVAMELVQAELDAAISSEDAPLAALKESELVSLQQNEAAVELLSIITNEDKFAVEVKQDNNSACSLTSEGSSCNYKINIRTYPSTFTSLANRIDDDVDEISLPFYHNTTATYASPQAILDDSNEELDPQDYTLSYKDVENTEKLILKSASVAFEDNKKLTATVLNDNFTENSEYIQFDLVPLSGGHTDSEVVSISNEHVSSIRYIQNGNTRFGQSQTISDDDPLVITIEGDSTTVSSLNNDGEEILKEKQFFSSAAENTYKYINYTATLSNPIAPDYGTVTLNLADDIDDSDGTPLQTANATDFRAQVKGVDDSFTESQSIIIHDTGTSTPDNARERNFRLEISPDSTLELDEVISQNPRLTGATATLAGLTNILYTIENDDFLTLTFTGASTSGVLPKPTINEGPSGTNTNVVFTYTSDVEIPADYPDLNITLTNNRVIGTAEMGIFDKTDDAILPNTNLHSNAANIATGQITAGELTFEIKGDYIVEPTEDLVLDLASNTGGVLFKDQNGDTITQLKQPIINDDFIQLELVPTSTGDLNETDKVSVNITTDYESEDLTESERQISFELISNGTTASATDYTIESAVTLPVDGNTTDIDQLLLTIEHDYIIEIKETLNLTLNHSQYMQKSGGSLTTSYSYDIANDDYLTVSRTQALIESKDDVINHFDIEICVPSDYTIQSGTGDLIFTATAEKITKDLSSVFKAATCDDFILSNSSNSCDLENGFTSNNHILDVDSLSSEGCRTAELLSATPNNDVNQNVAFHLILDGLSDDRVHTSFNTTQEIVIINDDFINMFDTGLTECVDNGVTGKNIVACDGGDIETGYDLQDAVVTDSDNQYPDLAYTYINEKGEPVVTKPTQGQVCIQDNNTGYIWTQTIVNPNGRNGFSWDDPEFPSSAIGYNCGFVSDVGKSWNYPSVQDLLSFWNAKKLITAREFGLLVSNETGDVINDVDTGEPIVTPNSITGDQYMRYWTDQSCGANHFFAVDFLSGEVHCQVNTTINSVIGVYK